MRGLLYAIGLALTALGFLALGADIYWSWKAHLWAYESIGGYLDRIDPAWTGHLRDWADGRSAKTLVMADRVLGWPVWPPAFIIGGVLGLLARRR